jgi:hypothetical protein
MTTTNNEDDERAEATRVKRQAERCDACILDWLILEWQKSRFLHHPSPLHSRRLCPSLSTRL